MNGGHGRAARATGNRRPRTPGAPGPQIRRSAPCSPKLRAEYQRPDQTQKEQPEKRKNRDGEDPHHDAVARPLTRHAIGGGVRQNELLIHLPHCTPSERIAWAGRANLTVPFFEGDSTWLVLDKVSAGGNCNGRRGKVARAKTRPIYIIYQIFA